MRTVGNYESIFEEWPPYVDRKAWWKSKRRKYNIGLVVAGIIAFIAYITILSIKSYYDNTDTDSEKYEFTIFTIFFQGIGYLMMMGVANLFYNLGFVIDLYFNKENSREFRHRLFNFGFWFSCALPFSIPFLVLIFA